MAQNVTIAGASYTDVPAITVPVTGGGTARFTDTSDATATADEVLSGFTAYGASGEKLVGTATHIFAEYPQSHASVFRGKYLGDSYTAAQQAQVAAGTFEDLYVGDYWTINGVNWRIADINYWLHTGDTECTTNHLVIVPDTNLYNAQMNTSNTTAGGYYGSAMRGGSGGISSGNLATAVTTINSAFGSSNILTKRLYLSNAVTSGYPSGGTWLDSTVDLMNEINVYGCPIFTPAANGSTIPSLYTVDKTQFALFRLAPQYITNRSRWWLRDVVAAAYFADAYSTGDASYDGASNSLGVRPAFAIK